MSELKLQIYVGKSNEVLSNDLNEKCNTGSKKTNISKEIEKLQNDLKHADHIINVLKKQEEKKDRERS
jgi:hypothetical protein